MIFFIIIASDRFRECHTQLAKEIIRMGKKFYFVRSKIDSSIDAEKRKKRFDQNRTLYIIREDCENGWIFSSHDNKDLDVVFKSIVLNKYI